MVAGLEWDGEIPKNSCTPCHRAGVRFCYSELLRTVIYFHHPYLKWSDNPYFGVLRLQSSEFQWSMHQLGGTCTE